MYDSWNLPEENSVKPQNSQAGKGPKGYKRSDERIREDACEALLAHPEIDATDIEVLVNDGVVTLQGNVESRLAKRVTEDLIENISGVSDVLNEIHSRNHTSSQKNASNGKKFKKADHRDH